MLTALPLLFAPAGCGQAPVLVCSMVDAISLPLLLEKVPAGFPSPASDYTEESLDLNEYLIKRPSASFYFTVQGRSMIGANIDDGDRVLVDRSIEPRHGHIVIAVVNNEYSIKRLYRWRGVVELRPENPDYQPLRFQDDQELVIWGVVTAIIRKLRV